MVAESDFRGAVVEMIRRAETTLPKDVLAALQRASKLERNRVARLQFDLMFKNLELAKKLGAPICQDTGTFTFFVKLGRNLRLPFDIADAITEAVKIATREVPLRANVVDSFTREPSKTNTGKLQPAIHLELVNGDGLQVELLVKGAGTENCGRLLMMNPADGPDAVEQAVLKVLKEVRGKPCPPNIVGVGVGGSMETATILAKRALLRPLDKPNSNKLLAKLERRAELAANSLDTGPMGLGGKTTILKVLIEKADSHTASLPIAVALQCWPARRARAGMVRGVFQVVEP